MGKIIEISEELREDDQRMQETTVVKDHFLTELKRAALTSIVDIQKQPGPLNTSAKVISVAGDRIEIEIDNQPRPAKVAFSCLVEPKQGDVVLYAGIERDIFYILSILERPESQSMKLAFPGDAVLSSRQGSLSISSSHSINLIAETQLNNIAQETLFKNKRTIIQSEEITAKGGELSANIRRVNLVSEIVHSFAERFMRKAKTYIRQTEVNDQIEAGQLMRKAKGLFSMKSNVTIMKSEKDTIIDGDHIFTGL